MNRAVTSVSLGSRNSIEWLAAFGLNATLTIVLKKTAVLLIV